MTPVTFVYPYYQNPQFFARQLKLWRSYPDELRNALSVIVVDDGSPRDPAENVVAQHLPLNFNFRLFRIEVDVRWNWLAARNIGAHHAADGWLMLTDMDHMVTDHVLRCLMTTKFDPKVVYRFSRVEHTGQFIHPHPNSWFMTRANYWRIGGYDETLSGHYGTDGDYRNRVAAKAPVVIMGKRLVRYEYIGDSSTLDYKRKQPEDAKGKELMRNRPKGWRPKVLSFPFHEVSLA